MKDKNRVIGILIIVLLLLGIALVIVVPGRNDKVEIIADPVAQNDEKIVVETEVQATAVQEASEPTEESVVENQATPTLKTGLESTDPATVNLESGQLQLVEAFAFW